MSAGAYDDAAQPDPTLWSSWHARVSHRVLRHGSNRSRLLHHRNTYVHLVERKEGIGVIYRVDALTMAGNMALLVEHDFVSALQRDTGVSPRCRDW